MRKSTKDKHPLNQCNLRLDISKQKGDKLPALPGLLIWPVYPAYLFGHSLIQVITN